MSFTLNVALDPGDLAHIQQLADPARSLWPFMREAMSESLDEVEYQAQSYMYATFMNTTGQLENAFVKYPGTFESILENTEDYGQRRNYGFSGMTDSLGRYYPYDPGIEWAETGVANSFQTVELIWQTQLGRI